MQDTGAVEPLERAQEFSAVAVPHMHCRPSPTFSRRYDGFPFDGEEHLHAGDQIGVQCKVLLTSLEHILSHAHSTSRVDDSATSRVV